MAECSTVRTQFKPVKADHEESDHRQLRLLRPRRERPSCRVAEKGDECAPSDHSITSSAVASNAGGMIKPSALAVRRLMTNWNLVGSCTGKLRGFSPRCQSRQLCRIGRQQLQVAIGPAFLEADIAALYPAEFGKSSFESFNWNLPENAPACRSR